MSGSSARKKAAAIGSPATWIASRVSITPGKPRIGGDHALAGNVTPAARQPLAEIFGQRVARTNAVKIKANERRTASKTP